MLRFRLFGVPFAIAPYFWVGSALLGSNVAHGERALPLLAIWVLCVLVSVVIHELGHALVSRLFGVVPQVMLYGLGGLTSMQGPPLNRWQGVLVSLAGPAAGIAFWGATLLAAINATFTPGSLAIHAVTYLLFINYYWTLFNLLPILPLDGGQVLRNVLGFKLLGVTRAVGGVLAAVLCVYFGLHGEPYLAVFLGLLAFSNFRPGGGVL